MTSDRTRSSLPFWPFLFVDALFLGLACLIFRWAPRPLGLGEAALLIVCAGAGAWSFLFPFLRREATAQKLDQAEVLAEAVGQIKKIELVAGQISSATAQWQGVQEYATNTADLAKGLADSMAAEAKTFTEFLQKANDSEKSHLRLEVEKLRRAEGEWLQVLTRILDHVFALSQAAARSGQPAVGEQIGSFQNACREVARRVGLIPFAANIGEALDPNSHQLLDDAVPSSANALVADTVATGYTYQGQLIRRAVVSLQPLPVQVAETQSQEPSTEMLEPSKEGMLF
jgi:molecular chaperone GrpE (heat shock protein)